MPGIDPRLTACKASAIIAEQFFHPNSMIVFFSASLAIQILFYLQVLLSPFRMGKLNVGVLVKYLLLSPALVPCPYPIPCPLPLSPTSILLSPHFLLPRYLSSLCMVMTSVLLSSSIILQLEGCMGREPVVAGWCWLRLPYCSWCWIWEGRTVWWWPCCPLFWAA